MSETNELDIRFRPSKYHLSNEEIRATGILCGGAVENIAREALELRQKVYADPSPSLEATLAEALRNLADSIRRRKGSKLIHINHDELRELIPKARAALAAYDAREKEK